MSVVLNLAFASDGVLLALVAVNGSFSLSFALAGQLPCDMAKMCHRHIFTRIAYHRMPLTRQQLSVYFC